jgi:hypothetical protein
MQDITNSSGGGVSILWCLLVCFLIWVCLCTLGRAARRATTWPRRLLFALAPILIGLIGVLARVPFEFQFGTFHLQIDLGWVFVVPLILGIVGLFGARHEPTAAQLSTLSGIMRYFRRRFLGFCLLPILLTALDYGLTLAGQPKEYWAGDYGRAHEMDPIEHTLLIYHPLAFVAVNAVLTLVLIGLILLTPRIVAAIFSIFVSLTHWAGASTWLIFQGYLNGPEMAWGLALLTIICMAAGVGWGWRAKSNADPLDATRLSFGIRWVTIAVLFVMWLAVTFLDANIGRMGKAWPLMLLIFCFCVYFRELKQRKRKLSTSPPNKALEPIGTAPVNSTEL